MHASMNMYVKFRNKQYAVVSPDEYFMTVNYGGLACYDESSTMIIAGDYLYPIYHKTPETNNFLHGCYCYMPGKMGMVRWVTNDESYRDFTLVDLSNPQSLDSLIASIKQVNAIEREQLTPDEESDVYKCTIHPDDSAAMVALKQFITAKNVDLNKYADRFGVNYTNDIRILNKNEVTIKKLLAFIQNLDGTCELVINNAGPEVANPLNNEIRVKLV